jgi:hypothetical protein
MLTVSAVFIILAVVCSQLEAARVPGALAWWPQGWVFVGLAMLCGGYVILGGPVLR